MNSRGVPKRCQVRTGIHRFLSRSPRHDCTAPFQRWTASYDIPRFPWNTGLRVLLELPLASTDLLVLFSSPTRRPKKRRGGQPRPTLLSRHLGIKVGLASRVKDSPHCHTSVHARATVIVLLRLFQDFRPGSLCVFPHLNSFPMSS